MAASRDKVIYRKSNSFGEFQVQNLNKGSKKIDFSVVEQKVNPNDVFINMSQCD